MNPTIAVITWGNRPREQSRLRLWIERAMNAAPGLDYRVLTDTETIFPEKFFPGIGPRLWRIDVPKTCGDGLIRHGEPGGQSFDVKGALVWAALATKGPMLVMDSDTEIRGDLTAALAALPAADVCMAPDLLPMLFNAGIIWFGKEDHDWTRREYWKKFTEGRIKPPRAVDLLEQACWNQMLDGQLSPTLNWAPHFQGANPDALIYHRHSHGDDASDGIRQQNPAILTPPRLIMLGTVNRAKEPEFYAKRAKELAEFAGNGFTFVSCLPRTRCAARALDTIFAKALWWGATDVLLWPDDSTATAERAFKFLTRPDDCSEREGMIRIKTPVLRRAIRDNPGTSYLSEEPETLGERRWSLVLPGSSAALVI